MTQIGTIQATLAQRILLSLSFWSRHRFEFRSHHLRFSEFLGSKTKPFGHCTNWSEAWWSVEWDQILSFQVRKDWTIHFNKQSISFRRCSSSSSRCWGRYWLCVFAPVWPDWVIHCTLATFQSLWQQLFCPNCPHFEATFVKVSKIFHFYTEIFFGQLL